LGDKEKGPETPGTRSRGETIADGTEMHLACKRRRQKMNYSDWAMLTEAALAGKAVDDYARLPASLGDDDEGRWTSGVSYWSDYVTIIDPLGFGSSAVALSEAS
jgi:hypothetical protein